MNTTLKSVKVAVFLIMVSLIMSQPCQAEQYPKPTGFVNDFANLLTREQGMSLNDELIAFEKKTTIEIAVVTVSQLNSRSIEDYARELGNEWGVGKRGQNNGIVFLIAPKERKMRIETAPGVRGILTDSHADRIRDNEVLPHFRSGNMAQGIIGGTHAIMRTFDVSATSTAFRGNVQTPQSQKPTAEDVFSCYLRRGMVGSVLLWFLIAPSIRYSKAKKYALEKKATLAAQIQKAEKTAKHSDVREETRKKLSKLKNEFSAIEQLFATSHGIKWLGIQEKLNSIGYSLPPIVSEMEREIALTEEAHKIQGMIEEAEKIAKHSDVREETREKLAKFKNEFSAIEQLFATSHNIKWFEMRKNLDSIEHSFSLLVSEMEREIALTEEARREGPELMKKIPGMIEAAEKKLAEGKLSPRAVKDLEDARTQYKQAHILGINLTYWPFLYLALSSILSDNESEHSSASSSQSSNPEPDEPIRYSSYGFGNIGGFGGGGGFGSGGGGSSGSW